LHRQVVLNSAPRAARTTLNAVQADVVEEKLRDVRNETVRKIDSRLCGLGMYEKVCLLNYFFFQVSFVGKGTKVIKDLQLGLPSGTIEHWSWMPDGGRAGLSAHVVWKVPTLATNRDLQKTID